MTVLLVGIAVCGPASVGAHRGDRAPNVIQLSYSESSGDVGANRRLEAFARHTHGMHFATTYRGQKASAPGKYDSSVTDTDIHGRKARHPWEPDRKKGGGDVVRLVHEALHQRGVARCGCAPGRAARSTRCGCESIGTSARPTPPLYPLDCELKVD